MQPLHLFDTQDGRLVFSPFVNDYKVEIDQAALRRTFVIDLDGFAVLVLNALQDRGKIDAERVVGCDQFREDAREHHDANDDEADRTERLLHLARDRMGEKPLYYGWCGGTLLFGSELKALRAHPAVVSALEHVARSLTLVHTLSRMGAPGAQQQPHQVGAVLQPQLLHQVRAVGVYRAG